MANEINSQLQKIITKKKELINTDIVNFHLNLDINEEIENYLKTSAFEILNIAAKSQLKLGQKFQEIADHLKKQGVKEGIYTKYVQYLGFNDRTVLRYRNRWNLYNTIKNENTKGIIAIIPNVYIEQILKEYDKYENILNEDITVEQLKILIDEKTKPIIELKHENLEFVDFKNKIFNLSLIAERTEHELTVKEKTKLQKLLLQIETILNK